MRDAPNLGRRHTSCVPTSEPGGAWFGGTAAHSRPPGLGSLGLFAAPAALANSVPRYQLPACVCATTCRLMGIYSVHVRAPSRPVTSGPAWCECCVLGGGGAVSGYSDCCDLSDKCMEGFNFFVTGHFRMSDSWFSNPLFL